MVRREDATRAAKTARADARTSRYGESLTVSPSCFLCKTRAMYSGQAECSPARDLPNTEHMNANARTGRRALVLGGGGAYGIVQAAYVQAAIEAGFRPDLVIGTSVGALNGAWIALYPERPEGLVEVWEGLGDFRVLDLHPVRLASRLVGRRRSICENSIVTRLVDTHLEGVSFEDTRLELAIVATNLTRGRKEVFRSGDIGQAIHASTAIPGVFEPYKIGGDLYVDGCVTASVDIASAIELGATEVLAIELSPPFAARQAKTPLGVLIASLGVLSHSATDAAEALAANQAAVHVLRPDLSGLSPWRLEQRPGLAADHLEVARAEVASALDPLGRVRAAATHRPRAVVEAPAPHGGLRLFPRVARRRAA